jgi:hypothetical protein
MASAARKAVRRTTLANRWASGRSASDRPITQTKYGASKSSPSILGASSSYGSPWLVHARVGPAYQTKRRYAHRSSPPSATEKAPSFIQ